MTAQAAHSQSAPGDPTVAALASWAPRLVGLIWCNVWGPSGPFLGLFRHGLQLGGASDWQPRACIQNSQHGAANCAFFISKECDGCPSISGEVIHIYRCQDRCIKQRGGEKQTNKETNKQKTDRQGQGQGQGRHIDYPAIRRRCICCHGLDLDVTDGRSAAAKQLRSTCAVLDDGASPLVTWRRRQVPSGSSSSTSTFLPGCGCSSFLDFSLRHHQKK